MAKVKGYLRLQGSMGETTFLKNGPAPTYRAQDQLVVYKIAQPGRIIINYITVPKNKKL